MWRPKVNLQMNLLYATEARGAGFVYVTSPNFSGPAAQQPSQDSHCNHVSARRPLRRILSSNGWLADTRLSGQGRKSTVGTGSVSGSFLRSVSGYNWVMEPGSSRCSTSRSTAISGARDLTELHVYSALQGSRVVPRAIVMRRRHSAHCNLSSPSQHETPSPLGSRRRS
jgi:hypothetical protein